MGSDFDAEKSEAFIGAARARDLLSDEQVDTLRQALPHQTLTPAQLAIDSGLMEPFEAEIAEAFAAPLDLAPGYELLDVLGNGALGVVYRAWQPHLKRDVAIKAIMQSRLIERNVAARFQQEIAAIGRLQHPNIVSAFDSGIHHRRLFLVMELVRGIDLRERLQRDGALDLRTSLSIVRQTAAGLSHAQAHGIIHRDIKPGNLMLTEGAAGFDLPPGVPLVKIADFGMARLQAPAEGEDATRLTLAGSAIGTPMYCSPEQLSGDPVDHRADIYALGATLVGMLSGDAPFKEKKTSQLIAAKLTGQGYRKDLLPTNLPSGVLQLIDQMMAVDARDRLDSYQTLIDQVDALVDSKSPSQSVGSSLPAVKSGRKIGALVGMAALAVLTIMAVIFFPSEWFAEPEPTLTRSTWSESLFDGRNVEPWVILTGTWFDDQDADLGRVLAGEGAIYREVPRPPDGEGDPLAVGVQLSIDLLAADAAEVHFGFSSDDFEDASRLVLRFTPQQVLLGRRQGFDGELTVLGHRSQAPTTRSDDAPDYHTVIVELHGDRWFVYFDDLDTPFANAKASPGNTNRYVQLVAPRGKVFFADLISNAMKPRGESGI